MSVKKKTLVVLSSKQFPIYTNDGKQQWELLMLVFILTFAEEGLSGNENVVTASNVCLYGLNIIMPLMTMDLLKFPSLCLQYFKVTHN